MVNWNILVRNIIGDDVAEGFNMLDEDLSRIISQTTTDITELFRRLEAKLEGRLPLSSCKQG